MDSTLEFHCIIHKIDKLWLSTGQLFWQLFSTNRLCIQISLHLELSVHDIWNITSEKLLYLHPALEQEKDFNIETTELYQDCFKGNTQSEV